MAEEHKEHSMLAARTEVITGLGQVRNALDILRTIQLLSHNPTDTALQAPIALLDKAHALLWQDIEGLELNCRLNAEAIEALNMALLTEKAAVEEYRQENMVLASKWGTANAETKNLNDQVAVLLSRVEHRDEMNRLTGQRADEGWAEANKWTGRYYALLHWAQEDKKISISKKVFWPKGT